MCMCSQSDAVGAMDLLFNGSACSEDAKMNKGKNINTSMLRPERKVRRREAQEGRRGSHMSTWCYVIIGWQ